MAGVAFPLQAGADAPADGHYKETVMIGGYEDLRSEVCEILGGEVTSEDVDVAVEAIVHEEGLTATTALMELNVLAQTENRRHPIPEHHFSAPKNSIFRARPGRKNIFLLPCVGTPKRVYAIFHH
jgi:hypothetical protein